MGRAVESVKRYAQEDSITIKKHWFMLVDGGLRALIRIVIVTLLYFWADDYLIDIADYINEFIPAIPFEISPLVPFIVFGILAIRVFCKLFVTVLNFFTVSLSINNVQLKGKTGAKDVGVINVPIKKVGDAFVRKPLIGRILGYGTISLRVDGSNLELKYMCNTEEFQDKLVLIKEARPEEQSMRRKEEEEDRIRLKAVADATVQSQMWNGLLNGMSAVNGQQNIGIQQNGAAQPQLENSVEDETQKR